ncbi:chromosome partition protein Smc [mine drainage metagenome]|jgi:chromosome segregation ATPase|uniref:Chromosome partition protein Smc n=1 Tax=mine drainage metagenome TaxID=410659 RepID=A0A1J5RR55_9ZZZZ
MAITAEQIWAAADALDAAGQSPTLAAVRKAVGGGSFTTISEAMAQWRARKADQSTPLREPAPPLVMERLAEVGADIWAAALDLANARLSSEREALEVARAELEASRLEAAQLADQLTVEVEDAKSSLEALHASETALQTQLGELKQTLAAEKASSKVLSKDLDQARDAAATAREQGIKAREELAELRGRLQTLQEQNAELLKRLPTAGK